MAKIGFWEALFGDVGYYERAAINNNHDSIEMILGAQGATAAHTSQQIRSLYALDHAQSKELARLRAIVAVLSEALIEVGFDKSLLEQRMEAVIDALDAPKPEPREAHGPGGPYRGGAPQPGPQAAPEASIKCTRCGVSVRMSRTTITEAGVVCDGCFF